MPNQGSEHVYEEACRRVIKLFYIYDHMFPVCREDCRRVKCVHCMGVEGLRMKYNEHTLRKNYIKSVQTQTQQILCRVSRWHCL